ncbi:MAG: hypothetical protein ACAH22_17410, partial [Tardiphaga sp.]
RHCAGGTDAPDANGKQGCRKDRLHSCSPSMVPRCGAENNDGIASPAAGLLRARKLLGINAAQHD